jgi:ketosteroid isomerase-like protein
MKIFTICYLTLALTFTLSCQVEVNVENEKARIKTLFDKYSEGWKELNIDKFSQIFLTNNDLVIITNTHKYIGWDSWKANIVEYFSFASNAVISFREEIIIVHPSGKLAWLSAVEDANWMKGDESKIVRDMRVSWVLEKIDGDWKVVQGHWSLAKDY